MCFAPRQARENDHDEDRDRQAGVHLQDRRLPLQSLHLQELRLLIRNGPRPRGRGLIFVRTIEIRHYVPGLMPRLERRGWPNDPEGPT